MSALTPENLVSYIPLALPLLLAAAGWSVVRLTAFLARSPRFFKGIHPLLGWQGYFHSNRQLYVDQWSRELFEKLSGLQQIFEFLGPEKIVSHQLSSIRPRIDTIIDEVMDEDNSVMWENLPVLLKNRVYLRAHRLLPRIMDDIIEEFGDSFTRLVSYQRLLEHAEKEQPGTLQQIYDILSQRNFRSMARFCAWLGFTAGCLQLAIALLWQQDSLSYWCYSSAIILFSFFALAQRWVRLPVNPRGLGRWYVMSPSRNARSAQEQELAALLANTVLSIRNVFHTLLNGVRSRHTHSIIRKRVTLLVEDMNVRTFVQLTVGPIGYLELKNTLTDKLTDAILEPLENDHFNQERATLVQHLLLQRLQELSDAQFHDQLGKILQPLAVIGGISGFILGLLTGYLQWLLISLST